ncbi:MAG: hypothetical protein R6U96_11540 [Promethearchaeia archaeon]
MKQSYQTLPKYDSPRFIKRKIQTKGGNKEIRDYLREVFEEGK